jgi:ADP-ribose pyrophosphatase YjhB (NUDIX family)
MDGVRFDWKARPGVTYSLRAAHAAQKNRSLFAMVDVIDDDPENRWLSVCFYGEMITDPEERGDEVPGGLLGEDASCFDVDAWDEELLAYVEARLAEAHASAAKDG